MGKNKHHASSKKRAIFIHNNFQLFKNLNAHNSCLGPLLFELPWELAQWTELEHQQWVDACPISDVVKIASYLDYDTFMIRHCYNMFSYTTGIHGHSQRFWWNYPKMTFLHTLQNCMTHCILRRHAQTADLFVAGWGTETSYPDRDQHCTGF